MGLYFSIFKVVFFFTWGGGGGQGASDTSGIGMFYKHDKIYSNNVLFALDACLMPVTSSPISKLI